MQTVTNGIIITVFSGLILSLFSIAQDVISLKQQERFTTERIDRIEVRIDKKLERIENKLDKIYESK